MDYIEIIVYVIKSGKEVNKEFKFGIEVVVEIHLIN